MKKYIAVILSLLLLSAYAIGYADDQEERTTIIGYLQYPGDVIREERIMYLKTDYLGWFIIKLPEDVSIDDVVTYEFIKVVLEEPRSKTQNIDDFGPPVNAVTIESVSFMMGKLIKQTDNYIDIEIWTFLHASDREREGQIQRIVLNDTPFTHPIQTGEDVFVAYEVDEEGNVVALLVMRVVG